LLGGVNIHSYASLFRTVRMKPSTSIRCTPFTCG
jgi:hypothetical protein